MSAEKKRNNIEDYLAWRADVPLSVDPFNEIDNLILCEMGYARLGDIVPDDGAMTVEELRDRYVDARGKRGCKGNPTVFIPKAPGLLDAMGSGVRFGTMTVGDHVDIVDDEAGIQIEAITFMLEDGTAYVCFFGTDDSVAGWKEDFSFIYLTETKGQRLAVEYLAGAAERTDRPIRVGGHSKGGNFAVYAAAFVDKSVQDRITTVYANEAPGHRDEVLETEGYRRIVPKVVSLVPETSIIGQLLSHGYPDQVVLSSENGIMQHDGFTWCLDRTGFIRAELSDTSRFIRQAHTDWLAKMDDDVRASFVSTLFTPIEATKTRTFHEMVTQSWATAEMIFTSINSMPEEKQKVMHNALRELLRSGSDTARAMIMEKINGLLGGDPDERKR